MASFKIYDGTNWVELLKSSDISSWAKASSKPSYTASEVGALATTGGTMTGMLTVKSPIFGYEYNVSNNNAAFILDKPGSNYTGIGSHAETDTIYFGACGSTGAWVDTYKQKWKFNGTIIEDGTSLADKYLGISAAAASAAKLNTNAGSATNPVYFSGGVPVACTYSLNKTVPADAVFTDHTYNFSGTTFYSGNSSNSEHNANSITYNGHYYYSSNGPAATLGDSYPNDGALYSQAYSTDWVGQIAQNYRDGSLYVRGKNNGTWTPWKAVPYADCDLAYNDATRFNYNPVEKRITCLVSRNQWDSETYSKSGFKECRVTFKAGQTDKYIMAGLNSDPTTNSNYQSIDYCWYIQANGNLNIYESGSSISSISGHTTYSAGDELTIEYVNGYVRYYHNGVLCRSVARTIGSNLYFDSSFYNGGNIYDVVFSPLTTHDYSSVYLGISATAADTTKLNGQAASYYLNYNNLSNKPTIPSVSNATITIKQTGLSDQTFTLNGSATTITLADNNTTYSAGTGLTLSGTQFSVSKANVSTMINLLDTGSSTPVDADYYISQYVNGGTTTTSYHRRPMSALWLYVKGKADSVYQAKGNYQPAGSYAGTAVATTSANGLMSSTDKTNLDAIVASLNNDDNDSTVNRLKDVLSVFSDYPEGTTVLSALNGKLSLTGGTMSGNLTLGSGASGQTQVGSNLVMGIQNDSYGLLPYANNWNQIGASDRYWYRAYVTNIYGSNIYEGGTALSEKYQAKGTYLTSHQSVSSSNNTASWGSAVVVGSVGGTELKFTMPSNPNSHNSHIVYSGKKSDGSTDISSGTASSGNITLGDSGVTAGTYRRVTVNAKGIVVGGDNTDSDTHYTNYLDLKTKVGSTETSVVKFTQNSDKTLKFIQGTNVTLTPDATNGTITIAATDTTYSAATQSAAGLMSASDKTKLDGIATGATANTGTVTGVKMNGTTKNPSSGVVDLGTVITSHQDISGKLDTSGGNMTGVITWPTSANYSKALQFNRDAYHSASIGFSSTSSYPLVVTLATSGEVTINNLQTYQTNVYNYQFENPLTPVAEGQTTNFTVATREWVNGRGYLTSHQSLSNYIQKSGCSDMTGTFAPSTSLGASLGTSSKPFYSVSTNFIYGGENANLGINTDNHLYIQSNQGYSSDLNISSFGNVNLQLEDYDGYTHTLTFYNYNGSMQMSTGAGLRIYGSGGVDIDGSSVTIMGYTPVTNRYEHNVCIYCSGQLVARFQLLNRSATALTYSTVCGALYNAGYNTANTKCLMASGMVYTSTTTTNIVTGVYATAQGTTLGICYTTLVSTSSSTATIKTAPDTNTYTTKTLSSSYTVNDYVRAL